MKGASWGRKLLLKRARLAYNSGNFGKSLRLSSLSHLFFRDRESLDIKARSQIRLRRFTSAARSYRRADLLGFKLLDHDENHFKSELESANYLNSFKILKSTKLNGKKKEVRMLAKHLRDLTDGERVSVIEEMSDFASLPNVIAELLPWAPRKISHSSDTNDSHSNISKNELELDRYRREISRLKESGSYRIARHVSDALRSPVKLIKLPLSFPIQLLRIISSKRGLSNQPFEYSYQIGDSNEKRDCVVFFPTNGVGFGHFTRLLAVAEAFRRQNPETEIVFFTTMPTLQILSDFDFVGYHMPSRYRFENMKASVWNSICEEILNLVFTIHRPRAFIFDGAFPYRGMLNAIKNQDDKMLKVWVRRGSIKKNSKNIPVESIGNFDVVIRPGDSGRNNFDDELSHNIPIVRTNPIMFQFNGDESRLDIRGRLGIPEFATICYLQLGAGNINDIESEISMTLAALESHEHVFTVVGESMIGERISTTFENVRILRDYPNSSFFDQFDFAVIAGGYNSYHEVIEAELPSICYPNLSTGRDDQLARAMIASEAGAMIVLKERSESNIALSISRIIDPSVRKKMVEGMIPLKKPNGSMEAALWLKDQLSN